MATKVKETKKPKSSAKVLPTVRFSTFLTMLSRR